MLLLLLHDHFSHLNIEAVLENGNAHVNTHMKIPVYRLHFVYLM